MRTHPNRSRVLTGSESEATAFDRWLTCQLRSMYADIASEPLPVELADLLEDREIQRDGAKVYDRKAREPRTCEHGDARGALMAAD